MKIQNSKLVGFSLVELLVVIAIIAVLSISSIVGFGYLGDILKAREVTSLLGDTVKQGELKVLRGDIEKSVIKFLPDYLVIEEQFEGASLDLNLGNDTGCTDGHNINYSDGNLTQKDGEGVVMQVRSVTSGSECVEFKNSEEIEWNYQLTDGDQFSNTIRFVHFNLQRENLSNPISIVEGVGSRIEVEAPYGKKRIYDDTGLVDSVDIIVEDESQNSSDTLTFRTK